jgi:murein DD-endopeptidase MepM/ murein hydrolase activator NlpD
VTANQLISHKINPGMELFIPGAEFNSTQLQEINGDLFQWPLSHRTYISSYFGYRIDPFGSGRHTFHTGIDIPAPTGTPIHAAMAGTVIESSYNHVYGNHVIIRHHDGYKTLYGHMCKPSKLKYGDYVTVGQVIGYVGSTGESTGPHCHFTIYKNGRLLNPLLLTVKPGQK